MSRRDVFATLFLIVNVCFSIVTLLVADTLWNAAPRNGVPQSLFLAWTLADGALLAFGFVLLFWFVLGKRRDAPKGELKAEKEKVEEVVVASSRSPVKQAVVSSKQSWEADLEKHKAAFEREIARKDVPLPPGESVYHARNYVDRPMQPSSEFPPLPEFPSMPTPPAPELKPRVEPMRMPPMPTPEELRRLTLEEDERTPPPPPPPPSEYDYDAESGY